MTTTHTHARPIRFKWAREGMPQKRLERDLKIWPIHTKGDKKTKLIKVTTTQTYTHQIRFEPPRERMHQKGLNMT